MLDKKLVENVKNLGLNSYEAKIWLALLLKGVATSGELSDITKVPRSRSYDVLESLESKGFVIMKLGKPIKYIAVQPSEVIERLKSKIKKETEQKAKMLDEFKNTELYQELLLLHDKGIQKIDAFDLSTIIKGRKLLYQKISEMISKATEIIILAPSEEIEEYKRYIVSGVKKNPNVKIKIYTDKRLINSYFKNFEVNLINLKSRIVIKDDDEVLFTITNSEEVHPNYDSGIWVKSSFFTNTLKSLIEYKNNL